jgi:ABC-type nitrate/sulfonate/bicarbonate transport system permease component
MRAKGRARALWSLPALIATGIAAALWQVLAVTGVLPDEIPPLSAAAEAIWDEIRSGAMSLPLADTVQHWLVGLVLGVLIGMAVGLTIGLSATIRTYTYSVIEFLRPIPPIIYYPLALLVLGASDTTVVLLACIGAFWPVLYQVVYGVRAVDPVAIDAARMMGMGPSSRLLRVVVPSTLPYIVTGIRISVAISLVVTIMTELLGGGPGLGAELSHAQTNGRFDLMYGMLLVIGILGLLANDLSQTLERRVLHWHPTFRSTGVPR